VIALGGDSSLEPAVETEPVPEAAPGGLTVTDADAAPTSTAATERALESTAGESTAAETAEEPRGERMSGGRPSRRRKAAAARARGASAAIESVPAEPAPEASPAVDSALSKRVETLEHGLRRVLDEVRQLRGLLAEDSGGDR
jgi:hypothetical protein